MPENNVFENFDKNAAQTDHDQRVADEQQTSKGAIGRQNET